MSESRPNSIRKLLILVFAAWLLVFGFSRTELARQDASSGGQRGAQSSAADLVKLYVSVVNKSGGFISKLNYYDFEVYCDKTPQQISYFSKKDEPVGLVLLVSTPGSQILMEMPASTSYRSI